MSKVNNANMPAMPLSIEMDESIDASKNPNMYRTGLTKREQFAAMAMAGLVTQDRFCTEETNKMAEWAVECADTLLAQLEKGNDNSNNR